MALLRTPKILTGGIEYLTQNKLQGTKEAQKLETQQKLHKQWNA